MKTTKSIPLIVAILLISASAFAALFVNSITSTNDAGAMAYIRQNIGTNTPGVAQTFYVTNYGVVWGIQPDGSVLVTNRIDHSWSYHGTNSQFEIHLPNGSVYNYLTNGFSISYTNAPTYTPTNIGGVIYYVSNWTASSLVYTNGQLYINGSIVSTVTNQNVAVSSVETTISNQFQLLSNSIVVSSNMAASDLTYALRTNSAPITTIFQSYTIGNTYANPYNQRIRCTAWWQISVSTNSVADILFTNLTTTENGHISMYLTTKPALVDVPVTNTGAFFFEMSTNDTIKFINNGGGSITSLTIKK